MSIKNIFLSILAITVFGSFAFAQGGGRSNQPNQPNQPQRDSFGRRNDSDGRGRFDNRGFGMMRGGMPGMIDFNRLNLTDAQKQRIQSLLESNRQSAQNNQAQFQEMGRLMMLKRQGLLTTEQGTRLTLLEAQMTSNRDRMRSDLLAILTPEQRTVFEQMQNERRGGPGGDGMRRMRERTFQRRGPGGPARSGAPLGGGTPPPAPPAVQ